MEGNVTFGSIPEGTYYIKEQKTVGGYKLDETVYQAVVDGKGKSAGLTLTDGTAVSGSIVVSDVYRKDIVFTKTDKKNPQRQRSPDIPRCADEHGIYDPRTESTGW